MLSLFRVRLAVQGTLDPGNTGGANFALSSANSLGSIIVVPIDHSPCSATTRKVSILFPRLHFHSGRQIGVLNHESVAG